MLTDWTQPLSRKLSMDATYVLGIILAIVAGIFLAVQSGTNATLGNTSGSKAFASVVSFGVGAVACLLYFLVDTVGLKHPLPSAAGVAAVPWWAWIGGVLGAYYVVVVILFAQKLGAGTLVAVFVCSQLVTSCVLDLAGIVGFKRHAFSWPRWVGIALMIAGIVLTTQFPGSVVEYVPSDQQPQQQRHLQGLALLEKGGHGCGWQSISIHSKTHSSDLELGQHSRPVSCAASGN
eukprot:GHRR01013119.1.p1 GENE.GHRR01013119.1~~GHRR01013119.1.p1  ORF type:complete len:234 (+),score=52.55 GHRR01013119.1:190-891(+)